MSKVKCLIFIFVLLFSFVEPGLTMSNAYVEQGKLDLGVLLTYTGRENDKFFLPIQALGIKAGLHDSLAVGFDYLGQGDIYQVYNLYMQYQFSEPILEDTWTSVQLGYSDLRYFDTGEHFRGGILGALFSRNFRDNWWAHTSLHFGLYYLDEELLFVPGFETGFQYYYTNFLSFSGTYRVHDLERHGFRLGVKFHFQ